MNGLTIGKVAKQAHVNIETIRYYERVGLIDEPPRSESGYRLFSEDVVQRISFIKKAQDLGFKLNEIKTLLSMSENGNYDCYEAQQFALQKISEIESKIVALNEIKAVLYDLTKKCPGHGSIGNCPIMNEFKKGGDSDG